MKESIHHYIDHREQEHDDQDTMLHNNRLSRELEKRAKLRGLRVVRLSGVLDLVAFGEGFSSQVKPGVSNLFDLRKSPPEALFCSQLTFCQKFLAGFKVGCDRSL